MSLSFLRLTDVAMLALLVHPQLVVGRRLTVPLLVKYARLRDQAALQGLEACR